LFAVPGGPLEEKKGIIFRIHKRAEKKWSLRIRATHLVSRKPQPSVRNGAKKARGKMPRQGRALFSQRSLKRVSKRT